MKKAMVFCLIAATVLMFGSAAMAGSKQAINTAPTGFSGDVDCSSGDCILDLSWDALLSTAPSNYLLTKYAVGVTVNTLSPGGLSCPDTTMTASFTVLASDPTALTVDLTTSGLIPEGYTLISVNATVKGMITPVKKGSGFSSNNALSTTSISVNSCIE